MSHIGMPNVSEALSSFHAHCLISFSFNCIKSQSPNYLRLVSQIRAGYKSQKGHLGVGNKQNKESLMLVVSLLELKVLVCIQHVV